MENKKESVRSASPVLESLPEECAICIYRTLHKTCSGSQQEINNCPYCMQKGTSQKITEDDFN